MEEIFKINVDNEDYEVRELDISPDESQYEICKNGVVKFTIEFNIDGDGNESWAIVNSDTSVYPNKDLIERIGDAIDSYNQ